jgi:hypothetical protein
MIWHIWTSYRLQIMHVMLFTHQFQLTVSTWLCSPHAFCLSYDVLDADVILRSE